MFQLLIFTFLVTENQGIDVCRNHELFFTRFGIYTHFFDSLIPEKS